MRASELMINDWVYHSFSKSIVKVNSIYGDSINYICEIPGVREEFYLEENYLEPIQLTPEILEKNNFEFHNDAEDGRSYYVRGDLYIDVNHFENCYYITKIPFKIHYVHELQHVMRICGYDILADEIKVK